MGLGCLSEPKSKLGLPRVTMGLNEPLNPSPRGGLKKIGHASSNWPPGNCCKGHMPGGQNEGSTDYLFVCISINKYMTNEDKFYVVFVGRRSGVYTT